MLNKIKLVVKHERVKIIFSGLFIIIGIASRTLFHIAPNVELVTAISLLAGYYLGGIYLVIVPLTIMVGSDFIIGNTNIFLFTWSAYIIAGVFGLILSKIRLNNKIVLGGLTAGITFSLFFYLYTNFGVWLITPWYEQNITGLLYCYYMGLPFLRLNLLGNLIFVPVAFILAEYIRKRVMLHQAVAEKR